jgi:hypothetical protein
MGVVARARQVTSNYGKEVMETKGLRLFLKPAVTDRRKMLLRGFVTQPENPGELRWYHFQRQATQKALGVQVQVTPIRGAYENAIRQPIGWLTERVTGARLEPTRLLTLPASFAIWTAVYDRLSQEADALTAGHLEASIQKHGAEYDRLIESDYRFTAVRDELRAGRVSREQARRAAYALNTIYADYYSYMDKESGTAAPAELRERFRGDPLFLELRNVIETGVPPTEGFSFSPAHPPGRFTEAQIQRLYEVEHLLYWKYRVIPAVVARRPELERLRADPQSGPMIASIEKDPFTQALIELNRRGVIDKAELQRRIGEDAYWQARFSLYETIGATRLKRVNGAYTDQPLTLEDIRMETIAEIRKESIDR